MIRKELVVVSENSAGIPISRHYVIDFEKENMEKTYIRMMVDEVKEKIRKNHEYFCTYYVNKYPIW